MRLLLDTHILLWAALAPKRLSRTAQALLNDPANDLLFSSASLWEMAIKRGAGCSDFQVDVRLLRRGLLENDYTELAVSGLHAVAIENLPPLHKDPFDRILLAQSIVEGVTLVTADRVVAKYPAPVRRV